MSDASSNGGIEAERLLSITVDDHSSKQFKESKLSLRGLSREVPGAKILDNCTLDVAAGQIVGLIGPSGSGKSTLLRALNRLWEPSANKVFLDGVDITKLDVIVVRRRIGMLFQTAALFDGTVADNVAFGPSLFGKTLSTKEIEDLLHQANLDPSFAAKSTIGLSGGQAQRVSLARTLANKPEVLLLDEPTSALDPSATHRVEETIRQLRETTGLTVVWVSHSVEQVQRVADIVHLLVKGQIVDTCKPDELLNTNHPIARQFVAGTLESSS